MTDLYESLKGLISEDENVSKVFDTVKNAIDEQGLDAVLEKFRASGLERQGASRGSRRARTPRSARTR